jgi:hypothetical protein
MKKITLLSFLLLATAGGKVLAQSSNAPQPVKSGDEWQMPKELLTRAKNFSENLQKALGLDEPTTKKIFSAYLGNTKSVDEIRVGNDSEKEKADKLAANRAAFDQGLKGLMTPTQFDGYLKLEKQGKAPL